MLKGEGMRWLWRYWPWLPPSGAELVAIAIGIGLLAAVLLAMLKLPNFGSSSHGFGPDWECTAVPNSEAVCVKRLPARPSKGGD
jgi:hypothetical protein